MRKPLIKKILYAVVLSGLAVFGTDWWFNPSRPTLDAGSVEAVEIQLFDLRYTNPKSGQAASTNVISDRQVIGKLLAIFAEAGRGSEHKAVTSGKIIFRHKGGGSEELRILPGYRDDRYEYRYAGRINYIDRAPFLAVLESVGILSIAQISQIAQ